MSHIDGPVGTAEPPLRARAIQDARRRLVGRIVSTPVIRCDELDRLAGARLWLKAENLQRGGSFKLRGALLAVERASATGATGVVAQSTGNHAIAVALAAREVGVPASLVLPWDAGPNKIRRIREAGATVELTGTVLTERMARVEEIRSAHGYRVIDPYQNPDVAAGQGTATAEFVEQVRATGERLAAVVLPVGGGSGIAGACVACEGQDIAVVAAEPIAVPEALRARQPVNVPVGPTIADGLRPDRIGALPFDICRHRVQDVLTVSEPDIAAAMCSALLLARLTIEPAAATALAAALRLAAHPRWRHRDIGVLITGGNVDQGLLASVLTTE